MPAISENITRGVKWTGMSSGINAAVKLIQISVLAHLLSPEAFGLIAIAYIFLTFGDIMVDMGLTTAILHFQEIKPKQYSSIFWVNIILGFMIFAILYFASWPIGGYYHSEEVRGIVQWLSLNVFILSISRLHKTYTQKHLLFKNIALIEIIGSVVMCVSAIIMAVHGYGVYSLVFSTIISSIIITILFLIYTPKLNTQIRLYLSFKDIREFYHIGFYQFLSSIVEFFSRETDTFFISTYFSAELLGYYTLCKQLTQRIYGVINPIITRVAVPTLACLQNNIEELKKYYIKMIRTASYVNSYIYGLLGISAYSVLYYLYGVNYVEYKWLLYIFAIYYAILSIGSFVGVLNTVLGKTKVGFIWSIYRVVSIIIVCLCTSKCEFSLFIFFMTIGIQLINYYPGYYMTIKKYIPMSFKEYILAQSHPIVFSLISSILILIAVSGLSIPWINTLIGIVVFSVSYYSFSLITKFNMINKIKMMLHI